MNRFGGIVVTGGAGFIGSAVVRRLIGRGDTVVNVDKLTYAGNVHSLGDAADSPAHHFMQIDICDAEGIQRVFETYRPRAVMHLAAESHVDRSIDGPAAFIQTNVVGTLHMLEAARSYYSALAGAERERFRFVHVSTDEVFGSLGDAGYFQPDSAYDPRSPYSASKASSDHLARAWQHTFGLPVIVTNCSNNYGPYQFPEKLIPLMILSALEGRELPVYGDGSNVRDWLYVDDHVSGLIAALENGRVGGTYLFGGNAERKNVDVVRTVCRILDELLPGEAPREQLIRFVRDRPGHDFRYAIDASVARSELGWTPSFSFEAGLRSTVQWFLDNPAWCELVRSGAYRGERLGLTHVESE